MPYNPNGLAKDPAQALELATLLQFLDHADPSADLMARLTLATGTPWLAEYHAGTDDAPSWAFCSSGGSQILLCHGTQTLTQAVNVAVGYVGSRFNISGFERYEHPYFVRLATPLAARLRSAPRTPLGPTFLVGHSLGGCVAQEVAFQLSGQLAAKSGCQICTFGSPKFCHPWKVPSMRLFPIARYMNSDDPVPMMYPSSAEYPGVLLSSGIRQVQCANRFTQLQGGLVCWLDGRIAAGDYPPLTGVAWRGAMGAWLWTWETGEQHGPHALTEYMSRIGRYVDAMHPPAERPRPTERAAPTVEDTSRVMDRQAVVVQQQLIAAEREQRAHPVRIPAANAVTVERRGSVHVVLWGTEVVSVCTRRRTARSLARSLNASLRHMLTQGIVETDAMQAGYDGFFAAARNPASGVTPQLNESLPGMA